MRTGGRPRIFLVHSRDSLISLRIANRKIQIMVGFRLNFVILKNRKLAGELDNVDRPNN